MRLFETNQKIEKVNSNISQDRIYLLFFLFFSLILIFSIKITFVSLKKPEISNNKSGYSKFTSLRRDITDRNNSIISRNIKSYHAAVNPKLIKDKENFLLKIRINFPNISDEFLRGKLKDGKYFYLKEGLIR